MDRVKGKDERGQKQCEARQGEVARKDEINENAIQEMDQHVGEVVEKWFYAKQGVGDDIDDGDEGAVVGDTCELAFVEKEVGSKGGTQTVEAFDFGIVENKEAVVPDKAVEEGLGLDYEGENQDEQEWAEPMGHESSYSQRE